MRCCGWVAIFALSAFGCSRQTPRTFANSIAIDEKWGQFVEPSGACTAEWNAGGVTFRLPAGLFEMQGGGAQTAPRIVADVQGDFAFETLVHGALAPKSTAAKKNYPYQGSGIVLWASEREFVRMERALIKTPDGEVPYLNFEIHGPGGAQPISQTHLPYGVECILRLERRGADVFGFLKVQDEPWQFVRSGKLGAVGTISVGLIAVNSSDQPFAPRFENMRFETD